MICSSPLSRRASEEHEDQFLAQKVKYAPGLGKSKDPRDALSVNRLRHFQESMGPRR